jgi:hypothetical protein
MKKNFIACTRGSSKNFIVPDDKTTSVVPKTNEQVLLKATTKK